MVRAVKSVCEGQLLLYIYMYNPMLPPMYARILCLKFSNNALMLTLSRGQDPSPSSASILIMSLMRIVRKHDYTH